MTGTHLRQARKAARRTQRWAADRLGVSQAYLSMLEAGKRTPPPRVAQRLAQLYGVDPEPPPLNKRSTFTWTEDVAAKQFGAFGYPGFSYLRPNRKKNLTELVRWSLSQEVLGARLAEALPWVFLNYADALDWEWLTAKAKLADRQNLLGFLVNVARNLAERSGTSAQTRRLRQVEDALERSRLVQEDTFFEEVKSDRMRSWLREQQTPAARHWNVLTDFGPDQVRYAR